MKITNLGVTSRPLVPQQPLETVASAGEPNSPPAATSEASVYTPSAELTRLVDLVHQQADVRSEKVQDAIDRYQQGDYSTPAAADQTAEAMLAGIE